MAISSAKDSRKAALLVKPIERAKKAVELDSELIKAASDLKLELDKEENERLEKLKRERVECEAAAVDLKAVMTAAKASRDADAATLSEPIERARKAAGFDAALLKEAEELKALTL